MLPGGDKAAVGRGQVHQVAPGTRTGVALQGIVITGLELDHGALGPAGPQTAAADQAGMDIRAEIKIEAADNFHPVGVAHVDDADAAGRIQGQKIALQQVQPVGAQAEFKTLAAG